LSHVKFPQDVVDEKLLKSVDFSRSYSKIKRAVLFLLRHIVYV